MHGSPPNVLSIVGVTSINSTMCILLLAKQLPPVDFHSEPDIEGQTEEDREDNPKAHSA